jgi:16S rRNA U516 pseudouridylate synthase RsuA-like enzyme
MFYEVGYEVKRLVRVRIGRLHLGELPRGHWRPLSKDELRSLSFRPQNLQRRRAADAAARD